VHTFEASLSNTLGVILYLGNKQPKSDSLALFLMDHLPLDCFGLIVEKLESKDVASLLYVSKQVRQDTMEVLHPQQCLWAAGKILNKEYAERALCAGARINKIDPATGKSVLKLIEGRSGGEKLYARLESWTPYAKSQNQEELNRHLVRCVKQLMSLEFYGEANTFYGEAKDAYLYPYEKSDYDHIDMILGMTFEIKEVLLDGADPNVRTQYQYHWNDEGEPEYREGGLLHLPTVHCFENGHRLTSYAVDIIRELKSFGIDMNQVDGDDSDNKDLPSQQTALHYACLGLNGPGGYNWNRDGWPCEPGIRPVIVKALLDCGTDPNKGNSHGMTPLHDLVYHDRSADEWVVEENHTLARMLIAYGADVTILNHDGKSVCDIIMDGELYVVDDDDDWIPDLVMLDICQSGWARMQILATQDH
jgi:hypothetical protein